MRWGSFPFLMIISLLPLVPLGGCQSAGGGASQDSEANGNDKDREVTNASKKSDEESEAGSSSETKSVIVTFKNDPSFQGTVPSEVLTDTLVALDETVKKRPKDLGILVTYLGLLRLHGQGGQIYDSVLRKAGPIGANNPWFLLEAGYGALSRKDFGLAEYLFDKAEKYSKGIAEAAGAISHARGISSLLQGRVQLAIYEMKRAASGGSPNLPALLTLGYMGLKFGDYQGAERSFRAAVSLSEKNVNSRMGLAIALRVKGNAAEAVTLLSSIYAGDKENRRVVWNYALALAEAGGKETEAMGLLEKYFQLPGSLPEIDGKATQLLNELQAKAKPKS